MVDMNPRTIMKVENKVMIFQKLVYIWSSEAIKCTTNNPRTIAMVEINLRTIVKVENTVIIFKEVELLRWEELAQKSIREYLEMEQH